jgi:hypothetical protein
VLAGRERVAGGEAVTLRVDHTRLHAFDPATGASLTLGDGGAGGPSETYTNSTSTPSAASA